MDDATHRGAIAVIALLELMKPADARVIQASEEPVEPMAVRQVHAAPSDPDVPGAPGPTTVWANDDRVTRSSADVPIPVVAVMRLTELRDRLPETPRSDPSRGRSPRAAGPPPAW
ncbi:hypothetical protein GCM10010430_70510 [Kitasatospora cystarginea]|uniref:Uncharacterized protein n=1 Tax=Kitasatospora cystarginea TaxID=58350 RepID=A0ABN3EWQ7_9ACTN